MLRQWAQAFSVSIISWLDKGTFLLGFLCVSYVAMRRTPSLDPAAWFKASEPVLGPDSAYILRDSKMLGYYYSPGLKATALFNLMFCVTDNYEIYKNPSCHLLDFSVFSSLWGVKGWRWAIALENKRVNNQWPGHHSCFFPESQIQLWILTVRPDSELEGSGQVEVSLFFFGFLWDNTLLCRPSCIGLELTLHSTWNFALDSAYTQSQTKLSVI